MCNENEFDDNETPRLGGKVSDLGVLDLRFAKEVSDLAAIRSISDVGVILVPEGVGKALASMKISDVGTIVLIPDGEKVCCLTGQTQLTGEALSQGDSSTILVVVGQLFISTQIKAIGYKEIRVFGQMFVPRGSEGAVTEKLTHATGQILYVGENPKFIIGNDSYGQQFLQYLPAPISLLVVGNLRLQSDVTVELLREKITEITLIGNLTAPSHLLPLIQVLTMTKIGNISAE